MNVLVPDGRWLITAAKHSVGGHLLRIGSTHTAYQGGTGEVEGSHWNGLNEVVLQQENDALCGREVKDRENGRRLRLVDWLANAHWLKRKSVELK